MEIALISGRSKMIAYFGHHKCATRWICEILSDLTKSIGCSYVRVSKPTDFNNNLGQFMAKRNNDFLFFTNAGYSFVSTLSEMKAFHVVRDARDICISAYFSHLYSHQTDTWPELVAHRAALSQVDFESGLCLDMEFSRRYIERIGSWNYKDERIMEIRFEDLTQNPYVNFKRVLLHLQLNDLVSDSELTELLERHSFMAKTGGREPGQEDIRAHYRMGKGGDWYRYFTPVSKSYFKELYNWVLLASGYEQSDDW